MLDKIKKVVPIIAIVVLVAIGAIWIFSGNTKHIEDTNGAENF